MSRARKLTTAVTTVAAALSLSVIGMAPASAAQAGCVGDWGQWVRIGDTMHATCTWQTGLGLIVEDVRYGPTKPAPGGRA